MVGDVFLFTHSLNSTDKSKKNFMRSQELHLGRARDHQHHQSRNHRGVSGLLRAVRVSQAAQLVRVVLAAPQVPALRALPSGPAVLLFRSWR